MDVQAEISRLRDEIRSRAKRIVWLRKHAPKLSELPAGKNFGESGFDFDNLTHPEIIKVIRGLGGKWAKSVNPSEFNKIDYQTEIDGVQVRCWAGQPPPSCKIVEVVQDVPEKVIPAHKIKIRKMVCTNAEPVAVAIAQANARLNGGVS